MPISKIPLGAIESGTISTSQIADNAVTTAKILDDNVTSAKIPNSAVGSTELSTDSIRGLSANNSDTILLNGTDEFLSFEENNNRIVLNLFADKFAKEFYNFKKPLDIINFKKQNYKNE